MKKYFLISIALILLSGCFSNNRNHDKTSSISSNQEPEKSIASSANPLTSSTPTETKIPSQVYLKVNFISQAPLFNWDNLHNEACEEASILNVVLYLQKKSMSTKDADQELIKMVDWQMQNFGGHYDLPIEKVNEFIQSYYLNEGGLASFIKYDISVESIKEELAKGNPVIVPAAGRNLGNPNFKSPGPVYHMLVIRGYDDKKGEFITNDVGTRKGDGYRYKYQKLFDTIHDMPEWKQDKSSLDTNPNLINQGKKAMIIIK